MPALSAPRPVRRPSHCPSRPRGRRPIPAGRATAGVGLRGRNAGLVCPGRDHVQQSEPPAIIGTAQDNSWAPRSPVDARCIHKIAGLSRAVQAGPTSNFTYWDQMEDVAAQGHSIKNEILLIRPDFIKF